MVTYDIGDWIIRIQAFLVDGWRITIDKWYEECEDYETLYDRRVIADSVYEALTGALCEIGEDFEVADAICAQCGIEDPSIEYDVQWG